MATQVLTVTTPDTHMGPGRTLLAVSAALANADNSAALPLLGYDEASVAVTGTFGAAGSVAVEGSYDGTTWFALPNPQGTVIAITAAGLFVVGTLAARFIRTHATAGDGTTALVTSIFLRAKPYQ